MSKIDTDVIGKGISGDNGVDNAELIAVNAAIRTHPVEDRWQDTARLHDGHETHSVQSPGYRIQKKAWPIAAAFF